MKVTLALSPVGVRFRWLARAAAAGAGLLLVGPGPGRAAEPMPAPAILQELRSFRTMGTVLYIAAHPDDENTQLITYLARGRNYRTAYLSVTRGDGGQNVLGPQFDEKLGVARTQELLAARRIDGGRQFFTRAIDFGYSKTAAETLRIWDRQQLVSDIVRVIRTFRPDVVIIRTPPNAGGHGQHSASGALGIDAFKLCGDPKAFPDQLDPLTPWQPKHLFLNGRGGGAEGGLVQIAVDGTDPVSGMSFAELAGRSRAMHKTQGFGGFGGGRGGGAPRSESFQLLDGEPATNDIMDGVDTTWGRVPGGGEIGTLADSIIAQFNPQAPAASVPELLKLKSRVASLATKDPLVIEKGALLDNILRNCLGLSVETVIPSAEVVPGETLKMRHTAVVRSGVPVRWLAVRYPGIKRELGGARELRVNEPSAREASETLPARTPLTQPYWLREEPTTGMFRVGNASLIGRPENPPVFPIEQVFEVGGQTLIVPDEPVQVDNGAPPAQARRRLDVIPPVSLQFGSAVALFTPGASHPVEVKVTAWRANATGTLQLDAPAGWNIAPPRQAFRLDAIGDATRLKFTITAPARTATVKLTAVAEVGGTRYSNEREEIRYDHIPLQLLQPPATLKALSLDLDIRGSRIGYLPGAGDSVDESLKQMGYRVTPLTNGDLTSERLKPFDAVVVGIRAFDTRRDLASQMAGVLAYVEGGGTVVMQYNRVNGLQSGALTLQVSQNRVTDENAPVTFLAPDHPALNKPNKISASDFEGWVQERGIYFPSQWDEQFTPILACNDPGEAPLKGGLLVAHYGKGYFVYTSLVFFRELPAGVPGAYRLFANLVSLGK